MSSEPIDVLMSRQLSRAIAIVKKRRRVSAASLRRVLRCGYNAAELYLEQMESRGLVSAVDELGHRTVLRKR